MQAAVVVRGDGPHGVSPNTNGFGGIAIGRSAGPGPKAHGGKLELLDRRDPTGLNGFGSHCRY